MASAAGHDRPTAAGDRRRPPPRAADRQGRQPRHADRCLAYGGRLTEARTQGESYLATITESATTPGEPGAIADAHYSLAVAYALPRGAGPGTAVLRRGDRRISRERQSRDRAGSRARGTDQSRCCPIRRTTSPSGSASPPRRSGRAVWVVARGGHGNPNLPRYARFPLLVLEGEWREARRILDSPDTYDLAFTSHVRAFYRGMLARAQGDAETAWRCVHEQSGGSPETEPGERFGSLPVQFLLLAAGLALDAGDLRRRASLARPAPAVARLHGRDARARRAVRSSKPRGTAPRAMPTRARDHAEQALGARDRPLGSRSPSSPPTGCAASSTPMRATTQRRRSTSPRRSRSPTPAAPPTSAPSPSSPMPSSS